MTNALILHGVCDAQEYFEMDFPSPSNAHWLPWLQQKFLRNGVLCQTPEMPKPYAPVYDDWAAVFEQFTLHNDTVIVGHSSGCGFILKWLSANPSIRLGRLVLVAPYSDPYQKYGDFLQCTLDPDLLQRVQGVDVLYSLDEKVQGVKETTELILQTYPSACYHEFVDKDHFCFSDIGLTFPELWAICIT